MDFQSRPTCAEEAECCPDCGENVSVDQVFQVAPSVDELQDDETFFHTVCPNCSSFWDEYHGWT